MRKIIFFLLLGITLCFSAAAWADAPTVNLQINGQLVYPETPPYIQDGYTMVPLRFISNSCGMDVYWDDVLRRVTVTGKINMLQLDIGSDIAHVNGEQIQMQVPAVIRDDYTMVPLRFIMENMEARVEWNADTRTVIITLDSREITSEYPKTKAGRISGYYFDSASMDMLGNYYDDFDTVINFAYKLFADGSVAAKNNNPSWSANAEPLLAQHNIEKLLLFTDFGDPQNGREESADKMLANSSARATAIGNIVALVEQSGADGVDIDFEKLTVASRDNFTAFIRELKTALGTRLVTVSLPPKRGDNETWLNKFDYVKLGQVADRLHIMFYDQHYGGSQPGPVATPAWIAQGLDYLTKVAPQEKLHVMLGAYGRVWGGAVNGASIHIPRALEKIDEFGAELCRDEASGVPYLKYKDKDGNDMVLWYEDAESLGIKAALARKYAVGGIGLWRMGIAPDDVWQSIVKNYSAGDILPPAPYTY
ncbi:MAG: stalk domain-containing protein [Clostridiales bacterium]|nr:stalk domain-containing protein [Clostridiales bacterium]